MMTATDEGEKRTYPVTKPESAFAERPLGRAIASSSGRRARWG